ncbi:DUF3226 domain-containing protein [Acinetobacter pittii]|uniref:DUF3226 domain-containing protein n=1 Tax=Acinetobacter pittii TaxID=48296 RepID=UPI003A88EB58
MNHKIIVESFNDQAIYTHILNNFCKSETDIEPFIDNLDWVELKGLEQSKLIIKLKEIKSELIRATTIAKIGIIIDLDDSSVEKRIEFLNELCSQAFELTIDIEKESEFKFYEIPEQDIEFELAYCFSGLNGQGELEDLLKVIADTTKSDHANCLLTGWEPCLKSKGIDISKKNLQKIWIDFYKRYDCLTSKQKSNAGKYMKWDNFLSLHPEKFDFSKDIPELNELKKFLTFFC